MSIACKAPVHRLLQKSKVHNPKKNLKSSTKASPRIGSISRRFFFLSLPISTLLLGSNNRDMIQSSSYIALADLVSPSERESSAAISRRVSEAVELLEKGRELQAMGDFSEALRYFTLVVENYKDLAFSDYARVGRALALYEVGDREEAITELEDVSVSLRGYPEVHAALAAALYADKHASLLAENQFTIATVLDPHYTDLSYVKDTKHWPPSLVSSLQHFITLT